MTELPSNDYISQINKNGSGLNIPQIVGALVDARIEPLKSPVAANKERVDAAISGLAQLKQSSELTKTNISKLKSSGFNSTVSTDTTLIEATVINQTLVKPGIKKITAVTALAQPMSFTIPGSGSAFSTASASYPPALKLGIEFGSYTRASNTFTTAHNTTLADIPGSALTFPGGTKISEIVEKLNNQVGLNAEVVKVADGNFKIKITGASGKNNGFQIKNTAGSSPGHGTIWDTKSNATTLRTALDGFDQDPADLVFKVDGLALSRADNTVTDLIPGVSLKFKALTATANPSSTITSGASKTSIQETVQSFITEINAYKQDLLALSKYDRTGTSENGDLYGDAYVKSRISALQNFMRQPIAGYTQLDTTVSQSGGDLLPRHVEDAKHMVHLSQLGFKTQKDGSIGFDQLSFDNSFKNNPASFDALIEDRLTSSNPDISVTWDGGKKQSDGHLGIQAGIYQFHIENNTGSAIYSGQRRANHTIHMRTDNPSNNAVGGVTTHNFIGTNAAGLTNGRNPSTGETVAGLTFITTHPGGGDPTLWKTDISGNPVIIDPPTFVNHIPITVHLGLSFTTLFENLHDDVLNNTYEHRRQVESYRTKSVDLEQRLAKIEMRSNSLAQMYNTQFQAMESSVTGFNTTGNYLTSVVDAWNK